MSKSTRSAAIGKPAKPRPDFPLFPHATRRWAKKVKGRFVFLGSTTDDPKGEAALDTWLAEKDFILRTGHRPVRPIAGQLTVRDLANRFLTNKRHLVDTRELAERTWRDYFTVCERVVAVFGATRTVEDLAADDFERLRADFAKTRGVVAIANDITRVRILFKFGWDNNLIAQPIRFGSSFQKPRAKALRQARIENGSRMLEAKQIRALIKAADQPLRAMLLLAANAGLGNADVGLLPIAAVDFKSGWLDFPRPKTAIPRRVPLWPETLTALNEAIAKRPTPKDDADAGLAFVTIHGRRWHKGHYSNPVVFEFRKLAKEVGIHRRGVGFYSLRHTFETVAGDTGDQVAVDALMGHAPATNDMAARYREKIDDKRLKAVTNHVRRWLFPPKKKAVTKTKPR